MTSLTEAGGSLRDVTIGDAVSRLRNYRTYLLLLVGLALLLTFGPKPSDDGSAAASRVALTPVPTVPGSARSGRAEPQPAAASTTTTTAALPVDDTVPPDLMTDTSVEPAPAPAPEPAPESTTTTTAPTTTTTAPPGNGPLPSIPPLVP